MLYLKSIESLRQENIIETRNRPILLATEDLNSYYCKYHRHGIGYANRLFKEYLFASFAKLWEFVCPQCAFIEVQAQHIPIGFDIPKIAFGVPCFGVERILNAIDLNLSNEGLLLKAKNIHEIRLDLLKLSFFDLWICNEDRCHNNYNIIVSSRRNSYLIHPIDHESALNDGNFTQNIYELSEEETLVYSSIFRKLFTPKLLKSIVNDQLKLQWYSYACSCEGNLDVILQATSLSQWQVDLVKSKSYLLSNLLKEEWFEKCWLTFLEYLQRNIK